MRFLFTCGGTAGHIYPAISVAGRIRELMPDAETLFVGAEGKMETELVPREGYEIRTVKITNLQRKLTVQGVLHNLKTVANLAGSAWSARRILKAFKPDVAIGTGGYVCYPVLRQAAKMGIPTVLHESNAVPGLTTRVLASKVDRMMTGFEVPEGTYKSTAHVVYAGTPVRGEFLARTKEEARAELGIPMDKPLVVSFWGSLGASHMNTAMQDFIRRACQEQTFRQIHATGGGEDGLGAMMTALRVIGVPDPLSRGVDVRAFIYDMPLVLAAADLVLCRAGASTLAELTAMGKPVVLVPSPHVTGNHQEENAKTLMRGGGAVMLRERGCTSDVLYDTVTELLADSWKLSEMAVSMREMGNPEATERIVEIVLDVMRK